MQLAVNPAVDLNTTLDSLAAKEVHDSKSKFLNTVASLPPLQSALLRELAADAVLGPDVRRPGLFSAAMKARLLARLAPELEKAARQRCRFKRRQSTVNLFSLKCSNGTRNALSLLAYAGSQRPYGYCD